MEIYTEKANESEALPKYRCVNSRLKLASLLCFMRARDMITKLEFRNFEEGNSRYGWMPVGREVE